MFRYCCLKSTIFSPSNIQSFLPITLFNRLSINRLHSIFFYHFSPVIQKISLASTINYIALRSVFRILEGVREREREVGRKSVIFFLQQSRHWKSDWTAGTHTSSLCSNKRPLKLHVIRGIILFAGRLEKTSKASLPGNYKV